MERWKVRNDRYVSPLPLFLSCKGDIQYEKANTFNRILDPPATCSKTIRSLGPEGSALDAALNKTSLWNTLDTTNNVTCLLPNTAAFAAAGNPQTTLSQADLQAAILQHTILSGPIYSDYITDGATYKSANNLTIRVTQNNTGTYFNDARVLQQNVLTNNGLVHVLDKVMSPINGEKLPVASNSSGSGNTGTTKPSAANGVHSLLSQSYFAAMVGFVVALLI
jgi:transforming growth factor-beta-induced protein